MKLNRKGYMLVEIIVASVLAMSIAYYLLNLTYKFKNTNEDVYQSYLYTKDKLLITKNIMSDLERGTISDFYSDTSVATFTLNLPDGSSEDRKLELSDKTIKYGKIDDAENYVDNDISYYEKELESTLNIKTLSTSPNENIVTIIIPIESIYDDTDYSIKLVATLQQ